MPYIFAGPLSLLFKLLVMLGSPVLALWPAIGNTGVYPTWLSWITTHDDWAYGFGWEKPVPPPSAFKRWKVAMWWLARNPGYGLQSGTFGYPAGANISYGDERKPRLDQFTAGDGTKLWSFRWNLYFADSKYIKLWFGWKPYPLAGRHMLVVDFGIKGL